MIFLRVGSLELQLHWSLWLLLGLMAASPSHRLFLLGGAAALCHELGHLAAMAAVGNTPRCLKIGMFGGKLVGNGFSTLWQELLALAAGPIVNLLLAVCFFGSQRYGGRLFSAMNLVLGGFNLLPIQGLDGGRMLWLLAEQRWDIRKARKGCIAAALFTLFLLMFWSFLLWRRHPHLPALLVFPMVPFLAFFRWLKD